MSGDTVADQPGSERDVEPAELDTDVQGDDDLRKVIEEVEEGGDVHAVAYELECMMRGSASLEEWLESPDVPGLRTTDKTTRSVTVEMPVVQTVDDRGIRSRNVGVQKYEAKYGGEDTHYLREHKAGKYYPDAFIETSYRVAEDPDRLESTECTRCNMTGDVDCSCGNGYVEHSRCRGSATVDCSRCNGNGSITCPECNGRGKRKCKKCRSRDETCTCRGNRVDCDCMGGERQCPNNCQGGQVPCTCGDGTETCGTCNGSTTKTCGTCDGEGKYYSAKTGRVEISVTDGPPVFALEGGQVDVGRHPDVDASELEEFTGGFMSETSPQLLTGGDTEGDDSDADEADTAAGETDGGVSGESSIIDELLTPNAREAYVDELQTVEPIGVEFPSDDSIEGEPLQTGVRVGEAGVTQATIKRDERQSGRDFSMVGSNVVFEDPPFADMVEPEIRENAQTSMFGPIVTALIGSLLPAAIGFLTLTNTPVTLLWEIGLGFLGLVAGTLHDKQRKQASVRGAVFDRFPSTTYRVSCLLMAGSLGLAATAGGVMDTARGAVAVGAAATLLLYLPVPQPSKIKTGEGVPDITHRHGGKTWTLWLAVAMFAGAAAAGYYVIDPVAPGTVVVGMWLGLTLDAPDISPSEIEPEDNPGDKVEIGDFREFDESLVDKTDWR